MKTAIIFGLLTLCLALPANAQGARWVTFKTGTWPNYGRVLYQIDSTTIKQVHQCTVTKFPCLPGCGCDVDGLGGGIADLEAHFKVHNFKPFHHTHFVG